MINDNDDDEITYLKDSFNFEISFAVVIFFEFLLSIIAGHLIIRYSQDKKSNLKVDPLTGMNVPSLIFAFNSQ